MVISDNSETKYLQWLNSIVFVDAEGKRLLDDGILPDDISADPENDRGDVQ